MKFTANAAALLKAVKRASAAGDFKELIPIYACALIVADDAGRLEVTSCDGVKLAKIAIECIGHSAGAAAVPIRLLSGALAGMSGDITVAAAQPGRVSISGDAGEFALPSFSREEFPERKMAKECFSFRALAPDFIDALDRVAFAAATEDTRVYLNGVCLHWYGGKFTLVATNSHILATQVYSSVFDATGDMPENGEQKSIILPLASIKPIKACLQSSADAVFRISGSMIEITCGDTVFRSLLVDGLYPQYEQIIPRLGAIRDDPVQVSVESLSRAINAASVFDDARSGRDSTVHLQSSDDNDGCEVVSGSIDGNSRLSLDANCHGAEFCAAVNPQYMLKILAACPSEKINLHFGLGEPIQQTGIVIRPQCPESGWQAVLMPIRIGHRPRFN